MSAQTVKTSGWNWNHSNQAGDFFIKVNNKLLNKCLNSKWKNFTGLPLAVALSALQTIRTITSIGELTIKGVGNLLGSFVPGSKFSAKKGAKQLLLIPVSVTLFPMILALNVAVIPFSIIIAPDWTKKHFILPTRDEFRALKAQNEALVKALADQLNN